MSASLEAWLSLLERRHPLEVDLGLERVRAVWERLGSPVPARRCVVVAGTNGKGSVASMLAGILQTAGFSVGLYTSPHLIHFNERIRIDGRPVTDPEIVEAYRAIRKVQEGDREPTFFEFTTAMALHLFKQHRVDWAVVETGMGGRLDATNLLAPEVSIITNISLEHKGYLGNTNRPVVEASYAAALFWTYLTEKLGTGPLRRFIVESMGEQDNLD